MNTSESFSVLQKVLIFGFFFAAIYVNYNIMPSNLHSSPDLSFLGKLINKVLNSKQCDNLCAANCITIARTEPLFKECLTDCNCEYQEDPLITNKSDTFRSFIKFYITLVIIFSLFSIIYLNFQKIKHALRKRFNINKMDEYEPLINN